MYILHDRDKNIIYSNVFLVVVIFLSLFRAAVVSSPEREFAASLVYLKKHIFPWSITTL